MAFSTQGESILLRTHEDLIKINFAIDSYKANPVGNVQTLKISFDGILSQWMASKSSADPSWANSCGLVDISMNITQKRVEKLLKKFPSFTPAQQIGDRASKDGYISFYDANTDSLT